MKGVFMTGTRYFLPQDEITQFIDAFSGNRQYLDYIRTKKFAVKSTDLTYRIINTWTNFGLLNDNRKRYEQGWRKFSIIDLFWIKIIEKVRNFGFSLEKIKQIKNYLFSKIKLYGLQNQVITTDFIIIEFAFFRTCSFSGGGNTYLMIENDGCSTIITPRDFVINNGLNQLPNSYIFLNLNKIAKEIFGDKIQIHSDNLFQLDETEIEFIKAKRLENNDSIILEQKNNSDIIKAQKSTYTKDAGGLHNIINQIKTGEIVNGNFYNGTLEKVTTQTKKVIKKNS